MIWAILNFGRHHEDKSFMATWIRCSVTDELLPAPFHKYCWTIKTKISKIQLRSFHLISRTNQLNMILLLTSILTWSVIRNHISIMLLTDVHMRDFVLFSITHVTHRCNLYTPPLSAFKLRTRKVRTPSCYPQKRMQSANCFVIESLKNTWIFKSAVGAHQKLLSSIEILSWLIEIRIVLQNSWPVQLPYWSVSGKLVHYYGERQYEWCIICEVGRMNWYSDSNTCQN